VPAGALFSYVDLHRRVRADHPLRVIRKIVDEVLEGMSPEFEAIYATGVGRQSIPPERLLRTLLMQAFYGIQSELPRDNQDGSRATIRMGI
jgi:transposase